MTQNRNNYSTTQYETLIGDSSGQITGISPGTSGQILTSNGAVSNPSYQDYPTYTPSIVIQKFTSSAPYVPTSGARYIKVEIFGGGASGGGSTSSVANHLGISSNGAAGGYARSFYYITDLTSSVSVTIGAGGAAPSAGNNNGNAGGTTSFGSYLSATGGTAGVNSGDVTTGIYISGGSGGTGSSGDINVTGGCGSFAYGVVPSALAIGVGVLTTYMGGYLGYGSGGVSVSILSASSGSNGVDASNYGGGGSGAISVGIAGGSRTGGAGASGFVVITEWVFS